VSRSHQLPNSISSQPVSTRGDGLVENGERVAHGTVPSFGDQGQRVLIGFDFFARGEIAQLSKDFFETDGTKAEMLATGTDSLRDVLGLGSGEHEDYVSGRFLKRF